MRKIGVLLLCVFCFSACSSLKRGEQLAGGTVVTDDHAAIVKPQFVTDRQYGVTEFVLENGAKVIVKEVTRAPVVLTQFWYRVGAADEHSGITGVSHLLEHLMFKGTEKYSEQQLTQRIKQEGGRYNAFTSSDYTAYYEMFEASHLPLSFEIETDRMTGLHFRAADFAQELEVVKEERRSRVDDNPHGRLYEQFYATAFNNAPYHHPVIGWMNDLETMTLEDARSWYQSWYAPNNLTVVVVGDVRPMQVYEQVQRYLVPIEKRQLPPRRPRREAPQSGERRAELLAPAVQPYILIGYRVPSLKDPDARTDADSLAMLVSILASGQTSRLYSRLVLEETVALSIGAGYDGHSRFDDLLVIYGISAENVDINTLEGAIYRELEKLKTELVSEEELKLARIRITAQSVYKLDSVTGLARAFGSLETSGFSWKEAFDFPERLKAVSPQQIREVAQKYLVPRGRTVAILKPEKITVQDIQK